MATQEVLEQIAREHTTDPNYEVEWDSLSGLLRTGDAYQDKITFLIDQLSMNERELIRSAIAYKSSFCPDYCRSRKEWLETAQKLKGNKLTPDEVIPLANKHRIYFAVTHPRGMNISTHNIPEEEAVYNFLCRVMLTLGAEQCRILGYTETLN